MNHPNQKLFKNYGKISPQDSNIKNNELTEYLERSGKYDKLLKNHLEGKYAAFFVHGDDGALDYNRKELPKSMENIKEDTDPKLSIIPIVQQCCYSGIFVPEDLIIAKYMNKGVIDYGPYGIMGLLAILLGKKHIELKKKG